MASTHQFITTKLIELSPHMEVEVEMECRLSSPFSWLASSLEHSSCETWVGTDPSSPWPELGPWLAHA